MLKQAVIYGIVVVIIGSVVSNFMSSLSPKLPDICKDWNKNHVMEICLFITGIILYFAMEKMYLKKLIL